MVCSALTLASNTAMWIHVESTQPSVAVLGLGHRALLPWVFDEVYGQFIPHDYSTYPQVMLDGRKILVTGIVGAPVRYSGDSRVSGYRHWLETTMIYPEIDFTSSALSFVLSLPPILKEKGPY